MSDDTERLKAQLEDMLDRLYQKGKYEVRRIGYISEYERRALSEGIDKVSARINLAEAAREVTQ